MAYHPHQHPIEDILNLSTATKEVLKGGDLEYATVITNGVFSSDQIPFDAILTDGENILLDQNGNVLWSYTSAVGRPAQRRTASAIIIAPSTPVPNRLLWQSGGIYIQDIDEGYYYRWFIQDIDGVPTMMLSDETFANVSGGESPYIGDLIMADGDPFLRNLSTGLYHQVFIEEVFGVATILISDQTYDIASGSGSITTGSLILDSGEAYLQSVTDDVYRKIFAQRIDGAPTLLCSDETTIGF